MGLGRSGGIDLRLGLGFGGSESVFETYFPAQRRRAREGVEKEAEEKFSE